MRLLIVMILFILFLSPSLAQKNKYYTLTGQSDSLFTEMVFFKKNDSIMFYIFDKNMNHISIPRIKGYVSFIFGKGASLTIKVDSSKYNTMHGRIQLSIPKEYWEGFQSMAYRAPTLPISPKKSFNSSSIER